MSIDVLPIFELSLREALSFRTTQNYEGVKIIFLTGYYAGKAIHLGSNTFELSSSQSANWSENEEKGIRSGINFTNISPRDLSFTVDFYSREEDVSQLAENLAHLHEIRLLDNGNTDTASTDTDTASTPNSQSTSAPGRTPPFVRIQAGKAIYNKAVCTNLRINYKAPHTDNEGFKFVTVDLEFRVPGGKDSEYQNAIPFAPTPLQEETNDQTLAERQEEAALDVSQILLDDCLGEKGSDQAQSLIEEGKLGDVSALLQLEDDLLIQLAIAGLPSSVYEDEAFNERLRTAIALEMVRNEPGLQNPSEYNHRAIAEGIKNSDPTNVHPDLLRPLNDGQTLFEKLSIDYSEIVNAIRDQKLGAEDRIFNRNDVPTAADRLLGIGSCGLTLRQTNVLPNEDPSVSEAEALKNINTFLQSNISDEEIRDYFNLPDDTPETVIRKIRNSRPYTTKDDFVNNATYNQQGITGYGAWAGAVQTEKEILEDINNFLGNEETTVEQIRDRFKVDKETAEAIKGKSFQDKQGFLTEAGESGQEAWLNSWKNQKTHFLKKVG